MTVRAVVLLGHEVREAPTGGGSSGEAPTRGPRSTSFSGVVNAALASGANLAGGAAGGGASRVHTVYQLRARVGPFECTSYRRFSDFLRLHTRLLNMVAKDKAARVQLLAATPTAPKLKESKIALPLAVAPRAKLGEAAPSRGKKKKHAPPPKEDASEWM